MMLMAFFVQIEKWLQNQKRCNKLGLAKWIIVTSIVSFLHMLVSSKDFCCSSCSCSCSRSCSWSLSVRFRLYFVCSNCIFCFLFFVCLFACLLVCLFAFFMSFFLFVFSFCFFLVFLVFAPLDFSYFCHSTRAAIRGWLKFWIEWIESCFSAWSLSCAVFGNSSSF